MNKCEVIDFLVKLDLFNQEHGLTSKKYEKIDVDQFYEDLCDLMGDAKKITDYLEESDDRGDPINEDLPINNCNKPQECCYCFHGGEDKEDMKPLNMTVGQCPNHDKLLICNEKGDYVCLEEGCSYSDSIRDYTE